VEWLNQNRDVFFAYKAALGFVWALNLSKSRYPIPAKKVFHLQV
jgi:hypothetical protein